MAIDAELISSQNFNLKFKNYLRDFYVYQFKERGTDFKAKGTNNKADVNKDIINGIFYPDTDRLKYVLKQYDNVIWSKGEKVDSYSPALTSQQENKKVESVSVDARRTQTNPFFSLYRYCSERVRSPGTYLSQIYAMILYFELGRKMEKAVSKPLSKTDLNDLNRYLISLAEIEESKQRRHNIVSFKSFSEEDKQYFAARVIESFSPDHSYKESTYEYMLNNYMLNNHKKLVYEKGIFSLADNTDGYIESNDLFYIMKQYGLEIDDKQFKNRLAELVELGIFKSKKSGNRLYYDISDIYIKNILGDNEELTSRFCDCVAFFSQISALGELGDYILSRLPERKTENLYYKHNYLKRALNDYNNIDLLYAIRTNLWAYIEYRNASVKNLKYQKILCYPIEIMESVNDGRQYLIYYHPKYRSISAVRVEFIDSITLGTMPKSEYFDNDLKNARELISKTWATSFKNFKSGNVIEPCKLQNAKIIIQCSEHETYIKNRIEREKRKCITFSEFHDEKNGDCLCINAQVFNPWELLQWLRSYTTRVVSVEINGREYNGFIDDVKRTYSNYSECGYSQASYSWPDKNKIFFEDEIPAEFCPADSKHGLIFNELFSVPFSKLGDVLLNIIKRETLSKSDLRKLEESYAQYFSFDEFTENVNCDTMDKRYAQFEGFINSFIDIKKKDNSNAFFSCAENSCDDEVCSIFKLKDGCFADNMIDLIPLTSIEIQWLGNILKNPLAKCFLTEDEIEDISNKFEATNMFDVNSIVLYDQFSDVKEFYNEGSFKENVRDILKAIRKQKKINIVYKPKIDPLMEEICSPVYIEYSKRDDRMRLCAVNEDGVTRTFNLERIRKIEITSEDFILSDARKLLQEALEQRERQLVLVFNETKNISDRVLTEFSCFKKKCSKMGNDRYKMTLYYSVEDSKEVLVRLLSYGSLIYVFDDTGSVRHELIERLENQLELYGCLEN